MNLENLQKALYASYTGNLPIFEALKEVHLDE